MSSTAGFFSIFLGTSMERFSVAGPFREALFFLEGLSLPVAPPALEVLVPTPKRQKSG